MLIMSLFCPSKLILRRSMFYLALSKSVRHLYRFTTYTWLLYVYHTDAVLIVILECALQTHFGIALLFPGHFCYELYLAQYTVYGIIYSKNSVSRWTLLYITLFLTILTISNKFKQFISIQVFHFLSSLLLVFSYLYIFLLHVIWSD